MENNFTQGGPRKMTAEEYKELTREKSAPPPSPVGIDVEAKAKEYANDKIGPVHNLTDLSQRCDWSQVNKAFKDGYAASPNDKITISYPDHYKMVLTNSNGDTYTSNSIELKDFLHNYKQFEVVPQSSTEEEKELSELRCWKESAMKVMADMQEIGKELGVKLGESIHDKILPAIRAFKAGYAASLPQSSTGGLPKLDQPILDEDDVKGIIESSTEEEIINYNKSLKYLKDEKR